MAFFRRFLPLLLTLWLVSGHARAQERLIYCNEPERIRSTGSLATSVLEANKTYQIFYHYRNDTGRSGEFVMALHGSLGKPLQFAARQGLADPNSDPPTAGEQAMARFFSRGSRSFTAIDGTARFAYRLASWQVASGYMTVTPKSRARLQLYFGNNASPVPGARCVQVDSPRCDVQIPLSAENGKQVYRIGVPEGDLARKVDGTYGTQYAFQIDAPVGKRVRVTFSPRGGHAGLVGTLNGKLLRTPIQEATKTATVFEATVEKKGILFVTVPYGGVFYPVELTFSLLP